MKKFIERNYSNYRFIRKLIGGIWYRVRTALPMADIWCRKPFKSCQAFIVEIENYPQS